MLTSISLDAFKNHTARSFSWGESNILTGGNGSGKTNILESIYLFVNALPPTGRTFLQLIPTETWVLSLAWEFTKPHNELVYSGRIGHTRWEWKVHFFAQDSIVTKARHLEIMPMRAVLFTPMEMNTLYLWPTLRRDFLDEAIVLAYPEFSKVKRDYGTVLKNRNSLLKQVREGMSPRDTLDLWDTLFIERAKVYYAYRRKLLDFILEHLPTLESLLENRYSLSFEYLSKVDFAEMEASISAYLKANRERDILTGHTYIGPHLDDFQCTLVLDDGKSFPSQEYLSRGENKTILIGLKFLLVEFIETKSGKETILLLDDLFSELDPGHIESVLQSVGTRQLFITTQNMPNFLTEHERYAFHKID